MTTFLQPDELEVIRGDFADLVNGLDGCDVILHWYERSGVADIYGRKATETEQTETVRAHVEQIANQNIIGRPAGKERLTDVQQGDVIFLFLPDLDLSNRDGLWFEVAGLGSFAPDAKPPVDAHARTIVNPSGQTLVQEVYARLKR